MSSCLMPICLHCWQIELEDDANEDVVFQESESSRSTICPVTQLEIEKPLKKYELD